MGRQRKMNWAEDKSWMKQVSVASEIGGVSFPENLAALIRNLSLLAREHCQGPYGSQINGFALVVRVSAEIKQYGVETIERIRRNKKDRYITADIVIPENRWKGLSQETFAEYLTSRVKAALLECVSALNKQKIDVDKERLLFDFAEAEAEFLNKYQ